VPAATSDYRDICCAPDRKVDTARRSRFAEAVKMDDKGRIREEEAQIIGDELGIRWDRFSIDQFRRGMEVELEHGRQDPATNVTNDDLLVTGKIALAHLNEFPDYYDRLEKMEKEAEAYWEGRSI